MSVRLSPAAVAALAGLSAAQLKALFAAIRGRDDDALISAIHPSSEPTAIRSRDPLLAQVQAILKPILAGSAEKAAYLNARLIAETGFDGPDDGLALAATVRWWAKVIGPEAVIVQAQALIGDLAGEDRREQIP
jgi:hypothetical protein